MVGNFGNCFQGLKLQATKFEQFFPRYQNVQRLDTGLKMWLFNRGVQAPGITIVGRDAKALSGWIGNSSDWCRDLKSSESVEECVEEHTYSRSNVLKEHKENTRLSLPVNSLFSSFFMIRTFLRSITSQHFRQF